MNKEKKSMNKEEYNEQRRIELEEINKTEENQGIQGKSQQ